MGLRRRIFSSFIIVCITSAVGGCTLSSDLFFEPPPLTPAPLKVTVSATSTIVPSPSETPIPPTNVPCAFVWANKDLPDETSTVQEALKKAGLAEIEVALSAYGENCLDTLSDTIVSFAAMQTDFFFSIPVDDLNDRGNMGDLAARILRVVAQFPPGSVPGTKPGFVALVYSDGRDEVRLWFRVEVGMRALEKNLSGEALFDALSPTQ